jgi:hypothetical protein
MFHKIGLLVCWVAAFIVTVLALAFAATPVVVGLTTLYQHANKPTGLVQGLPAGYTVDDIVPCDQP